MSWAVIYVLGTGAYCWFALPWMLRKMGPRNGKADEMERWGAIALTLMTSLMWPFFGPVLLIVLARAGEQR